MHRICSLLKAWHYTLICLAATSVLTAETGTPFPAPVANPLEGRIGVMVQVNDKRLRLDIGASLDLNEIWNDSSRGRLRIGADFFTFTRLRSDGNFKFPVETTDFYFGLNSTYAVPDSTWQLRLRVAHISSHLVDGFANDSGVFVTQKPYVYSREFVEALVGYSIGAVRPYAGFTYAWSRLPRSTEPIIPQCGVDVNVPLGGAFHFRAGYDLKLFGVDGVYAGENAAQAGVWMDMWRGRGLMLSLYGYDGRSMHGLFIAQHDTYIGIGMQLIY